MPLIVVYNLTKDDFTEEKIEAIEKAFIWVIKGIPELELQEKDVSFSFPQDPLVTSDEVMVTIIVELLFDKPKRNFRVRQLLAQRLAVRFRSLSGNENKDVEVAVKRFNLRKDGFCLLRR